MASIRVPFQRARRAAAVALGISLATALASPVAAAPQRIPFAGVFYPCGGTSGEEFVGGFANMGITDIEWTVTEFGSLIPGLIANRFDLVAASQAVLPARCEQVSFSKINSSYGEGFLVAAGNPKDIHSYQDFVDNPDLKLGIVSGADQLDFAQAYGLDESQIVPLNANADAPSALTAGRIDAYGATGLRAEKPEELRAVLEQGLNTPGTVVMDIIVHKETNVFPMIPGGAAHYEILLGPEDDEQKDAQPRELA